jgi:hypothetical protein
MDVSELRKRIIRALDEARKDASARRSVVDEAHQAFERFLSDLAVPLARQAAGVLVAAGHPFVVHTPAGAVRLAAETGPETYIEITLDTSSAQPHVLGRVSLSRGRQGVVIEERAIGDGRPVGSLTEDDVSTFLVTEIPKLIVKR